LQYRRQKVASIRHFRIQQYGLPEGEFSFYMQSLFPQIEEAFGIAGIDRNSLLFRSFIQHALGQ
jgi:hypothetical protein